MRAAPPRPQLLHPDMRIGELAEIMVRAACHEVEGGWRKLLDDDGPEGPHELRVGLRKLRVALHIIRGKKQNAATLSLRKSILSTGRHVGPLRDLDVLIDGLIAPLLVAAPHIDFTGLMTVLEAERAGVRAVVRKQLGSKSAKALRLKFAQLATDVIAQLEADRKAERAGKLGRRDLRRRWRKIVPQAETIDTALPEGLHELRKALKNLRYAFDHFGSFFEAKRAVAFDEHLRLLQATFGHLNDVTNAQALTTRLTSSDTPANVAGAIGFTLGWHSEKAQQMRGRLEAQWRDLAKTKIAQELALA